MQFLAFEGDDHLLGLELLAHARNGDDQFICQKGIDGRSDAVGLGQGNARGGKRLLHGAASGKSDVLGDPIRRNADSHIRLLDLRSAGCQQAQGCDNGEEGMTKIIHHGARRGTGFFSLRENKIRVRSEFSVVRQFLTHLVSRSWR